MTRMAPVLSDGNALMYAFKQIGITRLIIALPILSAVYLLVKTIYRIYFHPLSSYPGPKLAAATRLWYVYKSLRGDLKDSVVALHRTYGPVVRLAPNELSFTSSQSWRDIYGFRPGKAEMSKDTPFYTNGNQPPNVQTANREKHAHFRKLISRGFSETALREQQPLIQGYVNLLMQRLHEETDQNKTVNMVSWYNFFTFDIVGDLAFGEPFGCLENSAYHPWVKMIFEGVKATAIVYALSFYPAVTKLIPYITPKALNDKYKSHLQMTKQKALRRKESKLDRADFVSNLIKPENNVTDEELCGNSSLLIIAGSETTATLLCAVTWLLCENPDAMKKLVAEVRSSFSDVSEIDLASVSQLKYVLACLNEALRLFPPVPIGLPRKVPRGGDMIDGKFVPEGTHVSIFQAAANTSTANFSRPFEYIPERWLDDPRFINDDRAAMQPFSSGPRNCIGKNLAYVEMRLVLARLLWEFDVELCDGMKNWGDVKIFILAQKGPLWVKLRSVR